ncbi:MAG: IclR family transcriptional regulator [Deltaproteobacteria bacterium]|nr:IclR family transcriptional regulator [Deltaproteobacteria bacterium]
MSGKYQAPSVRKAFSILRQIARSPKGLNLSHLANQLEMSKGTAHGIISAMVEEGALIRDPSSKRYFLGPTLFELGKTAYSELDLREIARPIMEKLMEQTGASVFFGIPNGRRVSILDVVESNHNLKITAPRGSTIPLLAGAIGKIFLASMDPEQANSMIVEKGIPRFTARTITDPDAYLIAVSRAKENGYASDDEEYIDGVRAAAAPIRGKQGKLYAIWAVGFKSALDDHMMGILEAEIREAAGKIAQQINNRPLFTPPNA